MCGIMRVVGKIFNEGILKRKNMKSCIALGVAENS
jgi:hypothetical protein